MPTDTRAQPSGAYLVCFSDIRLGSVGFLTETRAEILAEIVTEIVTEILTETITRPGT